MLTEGSGFEIPNNVYYLMTSQLWVHVLCMRSVLALADEMVSSSSNSASDDDYDDELSVCLRMHQNVPQNNYLWEHAPTPPKVRDYNTFCTLANNFVPQPPR